MNSMSDKDNPEEYEKKVPDSGIFVIKGMQISIPEFSMLLAPEGWLEADQIIIHTGLDLCPFWLEIAFEHLLRTEKANDSLMIAKKAQNNKRIADALQEEFTAGMQTIMASAIAMDAYYANVKERIDISKELIKAWLDNGTARYNQTAEVIRKAFPMTEESAKQSRSELSSKKIQDFAIRQCIPHQELPHPCFIQS